MVMALPLLLAAMAASLGAPPGTVVFDNPKPPGVLHYHNARCVAGKPPP